VIFYDERQNEIWESERVRYGETWSGTIPVDAALWKLTREQKDFAPFVDFFSYRCREPMPLGLVLQHSQPDADLPPIHLGFEEIVQQEPTPCTCPDPALCGG
jgi:hypothetical protein